MQNFSRLLFFFFNDTATTEIYTLSLHDALPIFQRDSRPFKPHLTVARIRTPHGARELATAHRSTSFEPQNFSVSELILMRSELGPGGSRYTPLSRYPLGGRGT